MMGGSEAHFNRAALIAIVALAGAGGVANAQLPERVRATPEIIGRLTYNGAPVRNARAGVVLHEVGSTRPRDGCGSPSLRRTNDSGAFRLGAKWMWLKAEQMRALRQSAREMQHQFSLCVRLTNAQPFRVVFKSPALRWDTLHLDCDLGRVWLTPDREGREGHCNVDRAAIDGIELGERPARDRLPDVTCDTTKAVIQPLRVGPVRFMGSVEQLKRLCPSLRDTVVQDSAGLEHLYAQRALVLTIAGTPVIVHPQAGMITRIEVRTPGLRTADGVEAGMPASRLARLPNLYVAGNYTDIAPYAVAWVGNECTAGYYVSQPKSPNGSTHEFVPVAELRTWPERFTLKRIVIAICPQHTYLRKQ